MDAKLSQWCSMLTFGCQDITMMLYFNLWMKCQDTSILNYAKFYNISLTGYWEYIFFKSLLVLLYTPTCTSQVFNVTFLFLSTLTIGVLHTSDFYMYIVPPPPFSFWNITVRVVIQYHTNCNNSYLCDLQQKNDVSVNLLNGPTIYRSTVQ